MVAGDNQVSLVGDFQDSGFLTEGDRKLLENSELQCGIIYLKNDRYGCCEGKRLEAG